MVRNTYISAAKVDEDYFDIFAYTAIYAKIQQYQHLRLPYARGGGAGGLNWHIH